MNRNTISRSVLLAFAISSASALLIFYRSSHSNAYADEANLRDKTRQSDQAGEIVAPSDGAFQGLQKLVARINQAADVVRPLDGTRLIGHPTLEYQAVGKQSQIHVDYRLDASKIAHVAVRDYRSSGFDMSFFNTGVASAYWEVKEGDELQGPIVKIHRNGMLASIMKYKDKERTGHWRVWDASGTLIESH